MNKQRTMTDREKKRRKNQRIKTVIKKAKDTMKQEVENKELS